MNYWAFPVLLSENSNIAYHFVEDEESQCEFLSLFIDVTRSVDDTNLAKCEETDIPDSPFAVKLRIYKAGISSIGTNGIEKIHERLSQYKHMFDFITISMKGQCLCLDVLLHKCPYNKQEEKKDDILRHKWHKTIITKNVCGIDLTIIKKELPCDHHHYDEREHAENAHERENLHDSPAHIAKSRAIAESESVRRCLTYDDNATSVYSVNENTRQHIPQSIHSELSTLESSSSTCFLKGHEQNSVKNTRRKNKETEARKSRKVDRALADSGDINYIWINDKLRINTAERENVQLELNYKSLVNRSFVAHAEIYNEFALFLKVEIPAKLPMQTEINKVNRTNENESGYTSRTSVNNGEIIHEPHIFFREKKGRGSLATNNNNYTEHVLCISFDATGELFSLNKLTTSTSTKSKQFKDVDKLIKASKQQTQASGKNKKKMIGTSESQQESVDNEAATSERLCVSFCDNLPLLNFKITFLAERIPVRLPTEEELYEIVTNYCDANSIKINELDIDAMYDKLVKPNFSELDRALWNEESEVRLNLWSSVRRLCLDNYIYTLDNNDDDDPYKDIPHEIAFVQSYEKELS